MSDSSADSHSEREHNIYRLQGSSNYATWSVYVMGAMDKDVWDHVSGDAVVKPAKDEDGWQKKDHKAIAVILRSCAPTLLHHG